jgi:hypothetical protein
MPSDSDSSKRPLERRRHPNYAGRTAATTFGLIFGGLACLALGVAVRHTALRDLETVLNLAFVGGLLAALLQVLRAETTACPECRRTLTGRRTDDARRQLVFPCEECGIAWSTDPASDEP